MIHKVQSFIFSALLCGAALGVAATPTRAAAQLEVLAEADIPFSFHMGSVTLPAGRYNFSKGTTPIVTVRVRNTAKSGSVMATPTADDKKRPESEGAIVFTRYGNEYFLRRVDVAGSTVTYKWAVGKQEKAVSVAMSTQHAALVAVNTEPAPFK